MSEVVDLRAVRDARSPEEEGYDPHLEGPAKCLACKHEWHAVARTGEDSVDMVCPKCDTRRGQFQYPAGIPNDANYRQCSHCESTAYAVVLMRPDDPRRCARGADAANLHNNEYQNFPYGICCYGCGKITNLEDV